MDLRENYVVTSDGGSGGDFPANFSNVVRVEAGHKLALKSIFHGPAFNVRKTDNLLLLEHKTSKNKSRIELHVKPDFYSNTLNLTWAISDTINKWIDDTPIWCSELNAKEEHCTVTYDAETDTVELSLAKHLLLIRSSHKNVLDLLDLDVEVEVEGFFGYAVKNVDFLDFFPAFIYASVIESSFINNFPTRLLAVIPMKSEQRGYHFHEFNSPTYYSFAIREFSQIYFEIRDVDGHILEFDADFKTIILLEVFKPLEIF